MEAGCARALRDHTYHNRPLTTSEKLNPFHFFIEEVESKKSFAIISQIRLIDTKRLVEKVKKIDKETFDKLKASILNLLK